MGTYNSVRFLIHPISINGSLPSHLHRQYIDKLSNNMAFIFTLTKTYPCDGLQSELDIHVVGGILEFPWNPLLQDHLAMSSVLQATPHFFLGGGHYFKSPRVEKCIGYGECWPIHERSSTPSSVSGWLVDRNWTTTMQVCCTTIRLILQSSNSANYGP